MQLAKFFATQPLRTVEPYDAYGVPCMLHLENSRQTYTVGIRSVEQEAANYLSKARALSPFDHGLVSFNRKQN